MNKNRKKNIIIISSILFVAALIIFYSTNWAFYNIQRLKGQEYITELTSPDESYTVTTYLNNGGATTDYAVLGTLKNNKNNKTKNIYWQYHCEKADIEWLDNETVEINGKELNVKDDIYDYRLNE